jgi:RNA polymerase sigma-70 factor (ECF subfamily)
MSDTPSFEQVAAEISAPLRGYLERFTGDAHTAEDLLQEALLRISRGLDGFEGRSSLKTWAFSVATRTAIDHLRGSASGARIVPVDESGESGSHAPEQFRRIVIDEMNSCVREEIDSLPGDYRAALILHDLEGLTAAETATVSGCSLATAKIRIHRARARLREALERDCTFYRDEDEVLRCDRKGPDGADPD